MEPILEAKKLNLWYGPNHALHDVSIAIPEHEITAFIGPSGCGKSTFLRTLNRMNDLIPGVKLSGEVDFHGQDLYGSSVDPTWLRKQIGMVFLLGELVEFGKTEQLFSTPADKRTEDYITGRFG